MAKRNNSDPDEPGQELAKLDAAIAQRMEAIMELLTSGKGSAATPKLSVARKRTAAAPRSKSRKNPSE